MHSLAPNSLLSPFVGPGDCSGYDVVVDIGGGGENCLVASNHYGVSNAWWTWTGYEVWFKGNVNTTSYLYARCDANRNGSYDKMWPFGPISYGGGCQTTLWIYGSNS